MGVLKWATKRTARMAKTLTLDEIMGRFDTVAEPRLPLIGDEIASLAKLVKYVLKQENQFHDEHTAVGATSD